MEMEDAMGGSPLGKKEGYKQIKILYKNTTWQYWG